MQNSLFKLTALAGVVGIGFLVVLQAQKSLKTSNDDPAAVMIQNAEGDGDSQESAGAPAAAPEPEFGDSTSDPAFGVTGFPAESVSRPRNVAANDWRDVGQRRAVSDPFDSRVAGNSEPLEPEPFGDPASSRATPSRGVDFRDDFQNEPPMSEPARDPAVVSDRRTEGSAVDPFGEAAPRPRSLGNVPPATDDFSGSVAVVPASRAAIEDNRSTSPVLMQSAEPVLRSVPAPRAIGEPASRESAAPGPRLVLQTAGEEESPFFGDDLPSQPTVRSSPSPRDPAPRQTEPLTPEPEPALQAPTMVDFPDDARPATDDPAPRELKPLPRPSSTVEPVVSDDPFGDVPARPTGANEGDLGYRRTREPSSQDPVPREVPPPASSDFGASAGETPLPRTNDDPGEPGLGRPDPRPAFPDIPLDGSFPDPPASRSTTPAEDTPPRAEPERSEPVEPEFPRRETRPSEFPISDPKPVDRPTLPRPSDLDRDRLDPQPEPNPAPRARPGVDMDRPDREFDSSPAPARSLEPSSEPPRRERSIDVRPRSVSPDRNDLIGDGTIDSATPNGAQRPQLKIEKQAPPNAVLGQPMVYNIVVKNMGESAAHDVIVEDRIPKGAEMSGSIPRAELIDKTLVWKLGTMQPGEERKIAVRVKPLIEGQIGSITTVNFVAEVGAKTLITAPRLQLDAVAPAQVRSGESVPFVFKLKNAGTADAKNVVVRDIIPEGLRHADGNDLEYELGTLPAGQSREVKLTLAAVKPGSYTNRAVVTAAGNVLEETSTRIDVLGPALSVSRTGPKRSYLGRPTQFVSTVTNESERVIDGATVVETIPEGLEFVDAVPAGHFSAERRTVSWRIERMGPGQNVELKVKYQARSAGVKTSKVVVLEAGAATAEVASETEVVGAANLASSISTGGGPLGVGDRATYRVLVRNRGNEAASNVEVRLELPDAVEFVSSDNRSAASADGREVVFQSIPRLEAGRDLTFQVILKATRPGDVRLALKTDADDMQRPITQEEQVVILSDE